MDSKRGLVYPHVGLLDLFLVSIFDAHINIRRIRHVCALERLWLPAYSVLAVFNRVWLIVGGFNLNRYAVLFAIVLGFIRIDFNLELLLYINGV